MSVEIHKIRTDGGTQSRAAINEATVAEYAEAMADPDTAFPPVIVYFDGKDYWLADGFHRLAAWQRIGRTEVPAEIRQGDRRRAILHSVAANSAHGLRRSNEDKRRAVMTLLEDAEWSQWSNREIARRCAVGNHLVADVRASLTAFSRSDNDGQQRTYTTKHGTAATMNTANIGAGSKPDQKRESAQAAETKSESASSSPVQNQPDQIAQGDTTADGPKAEDPNAKLRRELSKLTHAALVDDLITARHTRAKDRAKIAAMTAEIEDLKAKLADLTADDKDEVIRRLQAKVSYAENQKWKANEDTAAAMKQVYALKKRVAELENMEVPL